VYELVFYPGVARDLEALDKSTRERILDKMLWLLEHVEEVRHKPLAAQ